MYNVSDRTTSVRLTRDQGIVPLADCTFEVRAVNGTVEGDWSAVRTFIGMLIFHSQFWVTDKFNCLQPVLYLIDFHDHALDYLI